MKKTILLVLLLILTMSFAYGFNVVKNGKSDCVIVLSKDANPAEKYAASEFQKYIKQSSGVEIEIKDTPQKENNIYIETKKDIKTDWDTVNIITLKNNLYLKGDNDRGTIYSVYEFLEKYVGVRFFTDDRIIVPKHDTINCPNKLKYAYKPSFMIRDTSQVSCTNSAFGVCSRMNCNHASTKPEYGGRLAVPGCHSLQLFLPIDKYGITHPEFYALKGGARYVVAESQPCFTNMKMRKELAKNVIEKLDKSKEKNIIDVSQNDNRVICECENCQNFIKEHGYSGLLIDCINYIADEVKKKYPNTMVETLAYHDTRHVPVGIVPRDNVMIRLCSIECNFAEPIGLADKYAPYKKINCHEIGQKDVNIANKNFCIDIVEWSKVTKNLFIWDYIINFHNYYIPQPNFQVLKPNLEFFHKHNVMGVYGQSNRDNYNSSFEELRNYVQTKLMWNLNLKTEDLMKEFCDGVYGAGSKDVQKCIDIFTDIFVRDHYYCSLYVDDMNWMSDSEIIESINLYKSALEKTKDDPYCNDRINTLYMSFLAGWYLLPDDRFEYVKKECNLPWNTKTQFFTEFRQYHESKGNPNWTELIPFDMSKMAKEYKKIGPTPEICKGLKDEDWYCLNNTDIGPSPKWGSYIQNDDTASGGKTVCLKNNGDWGAHLALNGNVAKDRMEGVTGYKVYAVCKAINKRGNDGDGLRIGVYDYGKSERVFRVTKPLSEIGEDWTTVYFGDFEFKDSVRVEPYFVGCKNDNFDAISIDKIIFVKIRN